jgi:hypothetical protein
VSLSNHGAGACGPSFDAAQDEAGALRSAPVVSLSNHGIGAPNPSEDALKEAIARHQPAAQRMSAAASAAGPRRQFGTRGAQVSSSIISIVIPELRGAQYPGPRSSSPPFVTLGPGSRADALGRDDKPFSDLIGTRAGLRLRSARLRRGGNLVRCARFRRSGPWETGQLSQRWVSGWQRKRIRAMPGPASPKTIASWEIRA